jgi:hypothetical protein
MRVLYYAFVLLAFATASGIWWQQGQGNAQQQPPPGSQSNWPQSQASFPPSMGWGGGGWGWGGMHASTAEQGMMMGAAEMMQAAGARNLMNSQALGFVEDARRKNIDNRMYGTDAYFQMRKTNREARAAAAAPPPTRADLERFARSRAPERLSPSDLDPLTGAITWPSIFRDDEYKEYRDALERMYGQRASAGYLTGSERGGLTQTIDAMQADLKKNIRNYVPQDYVQAKSFLDGLRYELLAPAS